MAELCDTLVARGGSKDDDLDDVEVEGDDAAGIDEGFLVQSGDGGDEGEVEEVDDESDEDEEDEEEVDDDDEVDDDVEEVDDEEAV